MFGAVARIECHSINICIVFSYGLNVNNKFKWAFIISNNHFFAFISHFVIQQDSSAKQAFIAKEIKKSERTVKSITDCVCTSR